MLDWRIYYSDNSTFDSSMGAVSEAPGFGVLAVVQPEPGVGCETLHAFDFYIYINNQWIGIVGFDSLIDYLVHMVHDIQAVKHGRMTTREQYQKVMRLALHDDDFPRKSGKHRGEKPLAHIGEDD